MNIGEQSIIKKIEEITRKLVKHTKRENKIALSTAKGIELVDLKEIIRLESHNNYTTFWLEDKTKKVVSQSIGHFESALKLHYFFRIHQSHIINLNHLKSFLKNDGGKVVMSDGCTLEVSRRKKEEFLKHLISECI